MYDTMHVMKVENAGDSGTIREQRECAKPIQTESSHLEKVGGVEVVCRGDKVLLDRASGLKVSLAICRSMDKGRGVGMGRGGEKGREGRANKMERRRLTMNR
jgi:hypothetical protein